MKITEAQALLRGMYENPVQAERMCFGDCCLRGDEKTAIITLIFGDDSA